MATPHQAIDLARRLLKSLDGTSTKGSPRLITYARSWLKQKQGTVSRATFAFYRAQVAAIAATRLGKMPMAQISRHDVTDWLHATAVDCAPRTANHGLKWLRMVMKAAEFDEIITRNPAAYVPCLKANLSPRRAFTLQEIQTLIRCADEEWQRLIYFGLYTGQRLGDLARLTWSQVDLQRGEVRLRTTKTGRLQILPLAKPLLDLLLEQTVPEKPDAPLHPHAHTLVIKHGTTGMISRQFYELMTVAGLVVKRRHDVKKQSPGRRHAASVICFHSLRHTATSMMKNAGVSPALVQEFIGHDSAEMNDLYTHIDTASLKVAADALPSIAPPADDGQLVLFETKQPDKKQQ